MVVPSLRLAWAAVLMRHASRQLRCAASYPRLTAAAAYALALRDGVEALVSVRRSAPELPRWPARLDTLHAISMLPVAMLSRSLRRDALRSAAVSAAFALLSR